MNVSGIGWSTTAICWMSLIFYLSSLSGQEVSQPFQLKPAPLIGHVILFSGLAAFLQLAIRGWNFEVNLRWVIAVAMFSSLFGISDEYHQSFVSGRHASIADASIDSISATVTSSLMWIAGRFTSSSWKTNRHQIHDSYLGTNIVYRPPVTCPFHTVISR